MTDMFGDDAPWHFWTPELIRRISGAPRTWLPPVHEAMELAARVNVWGPLLPLLHFHLAWERVDAGLARWAAQAFDPVDDPTLSAVRDYWGPEALTAAAEWSLQTGGQPADGLPRVAAPGRAPSPAGLHLDNHAVLDEGGHHWAAAYRPHPVSRRDPDPSVEVRDNGHGQRHLIVATYRGWYRTLEDLGSRLPEIADGRSWRIDVTIAPIGFVGTFRRSRVTGRWFTGRHRAHALGFHPSR